MNRNVIRQSIEDTIGKANGVFTSSYCEFKAYSSMLEMSVDFYVYLDQPLSYGLAERQLELVTDFLSMTDSIESVKKALFDHWDNGSDYWEKDFDIHGPEKAYSMADVCGLFIVKNDHWWPKDSSQLRFHVPWDTEHGAGVFIRKGIVDGFGDF